MATTTYTNYESLADISILSPFPGSITILFIVCFAFWIVWQVMQINAENRHYDEIKKKGHNASSADKFSQSISNLRAVFLTARFFQIMFDDNNKNRPDKFKNWPFPKGKYGLILAVVIVCAVVAMDFLGVF